MNAALRIVLAIAMIAEAVWLIALSISEIRWQRRFDMRWKATRAEYEAAVAKRDAAQAKWLEVERRRGAYSDTIGG